MTLDALLNHNLTDIIGFIIAALVIMRSGTRLSKYGDMMADMKGWSRMFMGIFLMAAVSSMPELMTGFSSVVLVDAPDLAVGDIAGSCAFNILIISIMDLFYDSKKPLTSAAQTGHVIAASFGIMLLTMVAFAILMPDIFGNIVWIGGFSVLFFALYFVAIRIVFLYEKKQPLHPKSAKEYALTFKKVLLRYLFNALLVMLAAMLLPYFGKHLSEATGLGQGFFGTLFIAASTSLPEIVVSVAAIRIGAIDLAIGNIFGSNLFNIGILALLDLLYVKGPIFNYTSPNHIIPVLGTVIITAIGISGIVYRSNKKWKLAIDSAVILLVYILMMTLLYIRN
jgi:cation:H+ antiporter